MVPIEADAGRDTGGEHALIQLSRDTGGKFYYATSLAQLDDAFHQINEELRTQYLLAYYPVSRVGNEFRRIRVELTDQAKQRAQRELVRPPPCRLLQQQNRISQTSCNFKLIYQISYFSCQHS